MVMYDPSYPRDFWEINDLQEAEGQKWNIQPFGSKIFYHLILSGHIIHWTCAVISHIARKMNNVYILSHDQSTHDVTAIHCRRNYRKTAI